MNDKERVNSQIEKLKAQRKKVEESIRRYEDAIEAMKGRTDDASHNKRQDINAALEKLRSQKEEISAEINKLEDEDPGADADKLKKEIEALEDRLEQETEAINDKIEAIQERIDQLVDGNDLLEHLIAKERLKLKIRFNREIVKHLTGKNDRTEITNRLAEEDKKLKDWSEKFNILIKEVDDKHGDDPEVKKAKESSAKEMESEKERIAELTRLHKELESAQNDQAKEGIQSRIDKLEKEQIDAEVESGKKSKEEAKGDKEQIELEKKISDLEDARSELEKSDSKEKKDKLEMVDTMLSNYRKRLSALKGKKKEENR